MIIEEVIGSGVALEAVSRVQAVSALGNAAGRTELAFQEVISGSVASGACRPRKTVKAVWDVAFGTRTIDQEVVIRLITLHTHMETLTVQTTLQLALFTNSPF